MRAFFLSLILLAPQMGVAQCRHALVLALDVSGSVDATEYALQVNGLADALDSEELRRIFFNGMPPIHIAAFEWSSQNHQGLIQPWIAIDDDIALTQLVNRIRAHRKQRQGLKTALGRALNFGADLMRLRPDCWQQTIDISADGKNNIGPVPRSVTSSARFGGITVNALMVAPSDASKTQDLRAYFQQHVIHGPAAFVMQAEGYLDYANAMQQKLARELRAPVFGANHP